MMLPFVLKRDLRPPCSSKIGLFTYKTIQAIESRTSVLAVSLITLDNLAVNSLFILFLISYDIVMCCFPYVSFNHVLGFASSEDVAADMTKLL